MADLLDIAPSTAVEMVQLGDDDGQSVEVRGITINAMASIISQFPELKAVISGTSGSNFVSMLITGCAGAIPAIIAAGVGHLGNKQYEQHAAQMMPEQQLKLLQAIARLTFPNGINAFLDEATAIMKNPEGGEPKANRMRSKKLPSPSSASAETSDSRPIMQ